MEREAAPSDAPGTLAVTAAVTNGSLWRNLYGAPATAAHEGHSNTVARFTLSFVTPRQDRWNQSRQVPHSTRASASSRTSLHTQYTLTTSAPAPAASAAAAAASVAAAVSTAKPSGPSPVPALSPSPTVEAEAEEAVAAAGPVRTCACAGSVASHGISFTGPASALATALAALGGTPASGRRAPRSRR